MSVTPVSASALPLARQWRIALLVLVPILALLFLAYFWFLRGDYAVLAKGIRSEQAAAIVEELKKEDIAYELGDDGTTIRVPAGRINDVRLDLAGKDLPLKGTVGFELFNQSNMGLTDFAQKINYQRALQGEIARTIMAMEGIASARVHIALPERSLFRANRSEPRAAVTLTPQSGTTLDSHRVAGIQRLVAASIPDLALDQVAVLNERGELLTPEFSDLPQAGYSQDALEHNYAERAASAIASAAPRAHVAAKVTVIGQAGQPATGSGLRNENATSANDNSIRVVVFERTPLALAEKQAIRAAVTKELTLDLTSGDQVVFSPAPERAQRLSVAAPTAQPTFRPAALARQQEEFLAQVTRNWTLALLLLGGLGLLLFIVRARRGRERRRRQLVERIKQQFLLGEETVDAA